MAELAFEAYGPEGDETKHLPLDALNARAAAMPAPPKDEGSLSLIVRRHPDGSRETLESMTLTVEEGVPGDGWNRRPPRMLEAQLAVMNHEVASLIANGQSVTLFGDQLFVDLDLGAGNLPFGSKIRVGDALVEMTPEPHNGCLKFKGRFGQDALFFVQGKETRDQNRRGVYWKVIEAGEGRVGSPVRVVSRG